MWRSSVLPLWAVILWLVVQVADRLLWQAPSAFGRPLPDGPSQHSEGWRPGTFLDLSQDHVPRRLSGASTTTLALINNESNGTIEDEPNGSNESVQNSSEDSDNDTDINATTDIQTNTTTSTTSTSTSSSATRTTSTSSSATRTTSTSSSLTSSSTTATRTTSTSSSVTRTTSTSSSRTTSSTTKAQTTSTSSSVTRTTSTSSSATSSSSTVSSTTSSTGTSSTTSTASTSTTSTSTTSTSTTTTTSISSTTFTSTSVTRTSTSLTFSSTVTFTSTSSTTSTTTIWGDILIALDFGVDSTKQAALRHFAADLASNVTSLSGDLNVSFGLVLFGEQEFVLDPPLGTGLEEFLQALAEQDPTDFTDFAVGRPPDTATALDICSQELNRRTSDVSIVVVLTHQESVDASQTSAAAYTLKNEGVSEVTVIAVGMDTVEDRGAWRQVELESIATSSDFEYDAYYDQDAGAGGRRLRSRYAPFRLSDLAASIVPSVSDVLYMVPPPEEEQIPRQGPGAGIILLAVLGGLCCLSAGAAVGFLVCKRRKEAEEMRLASVFPTVGSQAPPTPSPVPRPKPLPAVPAEPDDEMQLQVKAAMAAQDIRRVRKLLAEILLKGWPPEKYHALVLKTLQWAEAMKPDVESALRRAMSRKISKEVVECSADARLCGVDEELLREAAQLQLQLSPAGITSGSLC